MNLIRSKKSDRWKAHLLPGELPRQQRQVLPRLRQLEDRLLLLNNDAMNDEPKTPPRTGQGMDYGEQADVQQVHAAVQREKREPRVGAEPLSKIGRAHV